MKPSVEAIIELFEERAGIGEFEAGIPRNVAELRARLELVEKHGPYARKVLDKNRLEKNNLHKGSLVYA